MALARCVVGWALFVIALSPIILGVGWAIVEGVILPRLIPRDEIERLADQIMAKHPDDPEEAAFVQEQAAWFRSDGREQGRWHRVRKLVRKRLSNRRFVDR